jgi:hypothetical protein
VEGGIFDHRPIILHLSTRMETPPPPMKINQVWFEDVDFSNIVKA